MSKPQVVFVLGSARSGTSAITRLISLCGAALPLPLYAANEHNPRGFWEPVRAVTLNETFLLANDTAFGDPTIHSWNALLPSPSIQSAFISDIQQFLALCTRDSVVVIKDPRISELTEFWLEAVRREEISAKAIIAVRHPYDVAKSLVPKSVDFNLSLSAWMKFNLLSERLSRSVPRVFVDFSSVLQDWRTEAIRILDRLSLPLTVSRDRAIDNFLAPTLYRQRNLQAIPDSGWNEWPTKLYSLLLELTRDHDVRTELFDELYEDYQRSEAYEDGKQRFREFWLSFSHGLNADQLREKLDEVCPPVWNEITDLPH